MGPTAWDDRGVSRRRTITPVLPAEMAVAHGLAYALWMPADGSATGGIVILHGAGSCKESHYDFARAARALGFAALAFDARGHGESEGPMDGRVLADVAAMVGVLRDAIGEDRPVALRGSSMGGYMALVAAPSSRAAAVVAICPASSAGLRRGLERGAFSFEVDAGELDRFLAEHDLHAIAESLDAPVLLLHAEGDEQVPVEHSRELASSLAHPYSRLIAVPGGHHRSAQHDPELQAVSLKFIARAFSAA